MRGYRYIIVFLLCFPVFKKGDAQVVELSKKNGGFYQPTSKNCLSNTHRQEIKERLHYNVTAARDILGSYQSLLAIEDA